LTGIFRNKKAAWFFPWKVGTKRLRINPERVRMSKKYNSTAHSAIITNDLFLASFLHSLGCTLDHVERNDRKRVSFVFIGERVRELREAYRTGKVLLDMSAFRESMHLMRSRMDETLSFTNGNTSHKPYERSISHVRTFTAQPQC
jgi:hypothetical protein